MLYFPLLDEMSTATEDGGAFLDGVRLRVSDKQSLDGALTGAGQAQPGTTAALADRTATSFAAMSKAALHVRISVSVSHQLAQEASTILIPRMDRIRSPVATATAPQPGLPARAVDGG